jgi:O-antigen/teichoic acid export membrane protein
VTGVRAARNFLAGLSSSAWSAVVTLICVPFYVRFLGLEAYGLVGFFIMMQSILQLLDLGIAPTVNREVARADASGDIGRAGVMLRPIAAITWLIAALIALVLTLASPLIGRWWLNPDALATHTVEWATALIGLSIAARWPIGVYQGVLMGAQRLTTVSAIGVVMTSITSFGAIAVLAFGSPTVEMFFLWQAFTGGLYTLVIRHFAWRVLGGPKGTKLEWRRLASVWRFSVGMSLVAMSAIVLMQIDKAILSKLLDLEDFGRYTLAVLIANSLYVVLRPVFSTIYPKMSGLVAAGRDAELEDFYRIGSRLLTAGVLAVATVMALFSNDLIRLWTGDATIATAVAPIAAVFVLGTALNGVMHFPYALQLAYGLARLPLTINVVLIIVCVPMTVLLVGSFGAIGGAASWLSLNALYVLLGAWLTHRALPAPTARWLSSEIAVPVAVALAIVAPGALFVRSLHLGSALNLAVGAVLAIAAFAVNLLLTRDVSMRVRRALA